MVPVFFYLNKCFDTIDHTFLILKLEKYGIRNSELLWFSDYLQNRTQAVKIDGNCSSFYNLTLGVPQGSVLGPLLILIFNNDLPTCLTQTSIIIYADDTVINAADSTLKQVEAILQTDVDNMVKWFYKNRLMLNRSKSYSMLITTNPMLANAKLNIHIDGETISQVSTMKYLGIDIDSKLNWNNHFDRLCKTISPKIGLLRRLRQIVSTACLTKYYMAKVQSHIDYCLTVWGFTSNKNLNRLQNF